MIEGQRVLGVIPARGGSKGVPGKNIREVGGRPLISWAIDQARGSRYLDRTIVSSDCPEIISVALNCGGDVPFIRPASLAKDTTPGVDPALHAVRELPGYDYVVLLQPTSPLRTSEDIDACIELCILSSAPSAVSVSIVSESPYWMYKMNTAQRLYPVIGAEEAVMRRQDLPPIYLVNGALYVASTYWLKKAGTFINEETVGYVMPGQRAIDIDSEEDFEHLIRLIGEKNAKT
jgi:N-acylneuraminate cytidylyltransferase